MARSRRSLLLAACPLVACLLLAITPVHWASEYTVNTDRELFEAICSNASVIWLGRDLSLREEHWPAGCEWPVHLAQNLTISGPLDLPIKYTIHFNFMARRVLVPPYGEFRLRHFTARNTRRGNGGEIDFIAYSPKAILWTEDLNKNQIICLHADPAKLVGLPLPAGTGTSYPEFVNKTQKVELLDSLCVAGTCWKEVLLYEEFYTDVNVGSDGETGGYIMAKRHATKTCDMFVNDTCMAKYGGDACLMMTINGFLNALPPIAQVDSTGGNSNNDEQLNVLAIALPVALGGAALLLLVLVTLLLLHRRRRHAAAAAAAAEADAAAARKLEDAEKGHVALAVGAGSTSSNPLTSSEEHVSVAADPAAIASFGYETERSMGAYLGTKSRNSTSSGAIIEGVMSDGSTCFVTVGALLGQGSYGAVYKGLWQDRPVAVKVIVCDRSFQEQVANEVTLMTSESCRHPCLLRAYACMTRTRLVNRQHPAAQALEGTIMSLTMRLSGGAGGGAMGVAVGGSSGSKERSGGSGAASNGGVPVAETWIVSELCDLGSAAAHCYIGKRFLQPHSNRPRMALVLRVLSDIAAGMAHLHSLNVVHGDLKLANCLLCTAASASSAASPSEDTSRALPPPPATTTSVSSPTLSACGSGPGGSCEPTRSLALAVDRWEGPLPEDVLTKVADFGLSRWLKEGQTHHSTKTVGTVTYMPPELLRNGKLTLAGDVFAFGILAWELLVGTAPYKGLLYGEVVERVVVSNRRPEFPFFTPASYRALTERCWAAEASARPTFAEVLVELHAMAAAAQLLQAECDATPSGGSTPPDVSGVSVMEVEEGSLPAESR